MRILSGPRRPERGHRLRARPPRRPLARAAGADRHGPVRRPHVLPAPLRPREPRLLRPPARPAPPRRARARATELLDAVGLGRRRRGARSAPTRTGCRSASRSRARCCADPQLLLVDEATHDLDPVAAQQVRDARRVERARARRRGPVGDAADRGARTASPTASRCSTAAPSRSPARSPRSPRSAAATATSSSSAATTTRRSPRSTRARQPRPRSSRRRTRATCCSRSRPASSLGAAISALTAAGAEIVELPRRAPADRARVPRRHRGACGMSVLVAEARKVPAFMRRDFLVMLSYRAAFVGRPASTSPSRPSCSASSPS